MIDWGVEGIRAACQSAYVDETGRYIKDGDHLAMPYYQHVTPVFEQQIAKAGVRLANVINLVFA